MENLNGERGARGRLALCPKCGSWELDYDPKFDISSCTCGWHNELDAIYIKSELKELSRMTPIGKSMIERALALIESQEQRIKELTEENERLRAGDIIRLPLKVGDIVYSYTHFWRKEDGISPYQITNITITQNKKGIWTKKYRAMRMLSGKTIDDQLNFAFDEIGETVFLTLIDADRALKGE